MARLVYLVSLWVLQGAAFFEVLPAIAARLQRAIPLGAQGSAGAVALACAVLSVVGTTIALGYPALIAMRHAQRGPRRFVGLPRWAVVVTEFGAVLFIVGASLRSLTPTVDGSESGLALLVAGASLMGAGSLAAELLRRSVPATSIRPHRTRPWCDGCAAAIPRAPFVAERHPS